MAGRPTKLTPERQKKIIEALRTGNTRRASAAYAGVGEATFHEWLQRGRGTHPDRESVPIYAEFAEAVEKAEADAEVANVALIRKAAQSGTWQAAAWWLERRLPEAYGRRLAFQDQTAPMTPLTESELKEMKRALDAPSLSEGDRKRLRADLQSGEQTRVLRALSELGVRG